MAGARDSMSAQSAKRCFLSLPVWPFTWLCTQVVNLSSVQTVLPPSHPSATWAFTGSSMWDKSHLSVQSVRQLSQGQLIWGPIFANIPQWSLTSAWFVMQPFVDLGILNLTWESTQENDPFSVKCVVRLSQHPQTCQFIAAPIQVKSLFSVKSVVQPFHSLAIWHVTNSSTHLSSTSNAVCVALHLATHTTWKFTCSVTTVKTLSAASVVQPFPVLASWRSIWEFTQEKNHTNARSAQQPLQGQQTLLLTNENTQENDPTNANIVAQHSPSQLH